MKLTANDRLTLRKISDGSEVSDGFMPHGPAEHTGARRMVEAGLATSAGWGDCMDDDCDIAIHTGLLFTITDAGKATLEKFDD